MGAAIAVVLAMAMSLVPAVAATAAPVYEIVGAWEDGTPATVGRGDVVNAVWKVNVNDDAPAPSNEPVENVTFTVTVDNGLFRSLPNVCTTADGAEPVSAVSEDGRTLTCNLGTVAQGTAVAVQTPLVVDGATGDQLSAVGEINGQQRSLPPIDISNAFAMDLQFGQNTSYYRWNSAHNAVDVGLEWSLRLGKGSDQGPDTATYRLQMAESNNAAISVGNGYHGEVGCGPFNAYIAGGHPWSEVPTLPADQQTSFVDSCTLTPVAGQPGAFDLTLSGINYDLATVPTKDSTGSPLPTDWSYIASGSLWFRVATEQAGSISLQSNAPTYQSTTGLTSVDLAENNTTTKAYVLPGLWAASWWRPYTGAGGTNWDDTYRVSAGTKVVQYINYNASMHDVPATTLHGQCLVFDTDYVTYTPFAVGDALPTIRGYTGSDRAGELQNPPAVEYYVGAVANPEAFNCGSDPGNWTTTEPGDLSDVQAIRIVYPHSLFEDEGYAGVQLAGYTRIHDDAPVGQDIWMFGSVMTAGVWYGPGESSVISSTPGARYPSTNYRRDILRVITASPAIQKSVDRSVVKPGEPATFTLTYSANGAGAVPETMDGYVITDTLPTGMTYVAGSADPEPTISTNGSGQQVLTWSLDAVPTNTSNTLTYQAVASDSVTPGKVLTNTARSSVAGQTSLPASAQVTVSTDGYTEIGKTADTPFIPNLDGSGDGQGSWTVTLRSFDPQPQAFTDTIDILPFRGDDRGTDYAGSYSLAGVDAANGATVYYTTADPAALSDDPADDANGGAGTPSDLWSTTPTADATAVRVIGPRLAPGTTQAFTVRIQTDGAEGGDVLVNRAQARAENTELVMRTSAPMSVANYYSASLKKHVQDADGTWRDANDITDYPSFKVGDTVRYRIVVTNTGQGTLRNIEVSDDKQPEAGAFTIDVLAPEASQSHEYEITLAEGGPASVVNTASATADTPEDSQVPPTINTDPAGFEVVSDAGVVKSSDPASGTVVQPGQEVLYTLTFSNDQDGRAIVDHTDHLARVLDDADLVPDSLTAGDGLTATLAEDGRSVRIEGVLAAQSTATVTYAVTVKDSGFGDAVLGNVVVPGTSVPPAECVPGSGTCTEHPVDAVPAVAKSASPASGTTVVPGQSITYSVTATNNGGSPAQDVVLTDDLSDVLDDAAFDAGSARLTVADADPVAVADPDGSTLLTAPFTLAAGATATLSYTVTVDADAWNTTLRNVVTGEWDGNRPITDCEPCTTEHQTDGALLIQKTGGSGEPGAAPLDGSAWTVYADNDGSPGAPVTGPDTETNIVLEPVDGAVGRFLLSNVPAGTYWLEETQAPEGYSLLAEPVRFTVAEDGTAVLGEGAGNGAVTLGTEEESGLPLITVRDVPALRLPQTGGAGTAGFLIGGGLLTAAAAGLALIARLRSAKASAKAPTA